MKNMKKRIVYLILAISLILNTFTYNISYALETNKDIIIRVYTNKEYIKQGTKGVDYNISYIFIEHQSGYTVDDDKFDLKNLDKVVKIIVNGQEESPIDSKGNLKYTVEYNNTLNRIEIRVKEDQSNLTHFKPFILRKHSHYNIHIPKGFFTNGKDSSDVINFNFTTKGDGEYGQDILKSADPSHNDTEIDYKNGKIILSFIDDIELNKDAENKKDEYFSIISEKMTDPAVDNFNKAVEENINNYLIYVEGNKLIFKNKIGELDDFSKYKVTIVKNGVFLKNSKGIRNISPISNDILIISFDTNNWVEWTYPLNNQGTIDNERVELNPLIKIKFKYDVELIDKSKITLSSDGHIYAVDVDKDTWINYDGDILKIDINSLYRAGQNPLRANTAYKLTIGKGALRLKDYNIAGTDNRMENEEINLYFITGEHFKISDVGLKPAKYTSKPEKSHDDITRLTSTRLDKDGNIYIHFHTDGAFPRQLKWNQWTAKHKVKTDEEALKYFKLYKSPQAYARDHDANGIVYDKEFRYNIDGQSIPINGLDEIPLQSVEIVKDENGDNTNILKITPKYDLIPYNKYFIILTERDILTDNYEKTMGENENLVSEKGQEIWTAPLSKEELPKEPVWEMDKITPEQIIEVEKGAYKSTYVIHGASNYNSNNKPIILYIDQEVVLNPHILKPSDGITLYEGYREGDKSTQKRKIEWYKLEYFIEEGVKKTKISLYPQGELDSGKYYELDIAKDVFKSRRDQGLESINLQFVVEGDQKPSKGTGIYKFQITNKEDVIGEVKKRPLLITDFEKEKKDIQFSITGYNFTEGIKQLRFVRRPDGKTITLSSENLEFQDVTNITGSIKDQAKAEFARIIKEDNRECGITRTSAGVYDIYIDFENGKTASIETIDQRFIVKIDQKS